MSYNEDFSALFAERLMVILARKDWTVTKLEREMKAQGYKFSAVSVRHWRSKRSSPGGVTIFGLCEVLDVPCEELFFGADQKPKSSADLELFDKIMAMTPEAREAISHIRKLSPEEAAIAKSLLSSIE